MSTAQAHVSFETSMCEVPHDVSRKLAQHGALEYGSDLRVNEHQKIKTLSH